MRLPHPTSHYSSRVRYGRYLTRRLRQAKMETLAADVETVTEAVKQAGRELEDAEDPIQDAMAERDGNDADLDFAAQSGRNSLAGRALEAVRTEPYRSIFDKPISYYIAAPLTEQKQRYQELAKRMAEHLPADDSVRVATVSAIEEGLKGFDAAVSALDDARADASMLSTKLNAATEAWSRQIEKTYGALVIELGRARANGFFPRVGSRRTASRPKAEPLVSEPTD